MRESKIEKYLRAEVAKLGGWMEKHVSPGTAGAVDDMVMWPHNAMLWASNPLWSTVRYHSLPVVEFIETKTKGGTLSALQKRDHKRRRDMGFQVHVIWTMEQAEIYLKSRGKK